MTTRQATARRLLSTLLTAALGIAGAACSDSDNNTTGDTSPITTDSGAGVVVDAGPVVVADAGGGGGGSCLSAVYTGLSDGCKSCACTTDAVLAPSCGKPCWDFLACSFAAKDGKCAASAAGGPAKRAEFEACTLDECGSFLAVPGAQVVSSYRSIIGACADSMGGAPLACTADVDKFKAAIGK